MFQNHCHTQMSSITTSGKRIWPLAASLVIPMCRQLWEPLVLCKHSLAILGPQRGGDSADPTSLSHLLIHGASIKKSALKMVHFWFVCLFVPLLKS